VTGEQREGSVETKSCSAGKCAFVDCNAFAHKLVKLGGDLVFLARPAND
jgi:hypothetical protein